MTKQQSKRFLIVCLVLTVIIFKWLIFGSPVFKYFARNTVEDYIQRNYENCYIDGEIEYSVFSLFSPHIATVKSYDNPDFCINVYTDITGLFINQNAMEFFNE